MLNANLPEVPLYFVVCAGIVTLLNFLIKRLFKKTQDEK